MPKRAAAHSYSFTREEYVHPRIVEELVGWMSDVGQTTTTIDLVAANDSNRFFGDTETRHDGEHLWVEYRRPDGEGSFCYRYVGTSPSGVHILLCADHMGGSGVFINVILLSFRADTAIDGYSGHVETKARVLLHTVGLIGLGDRYSGSVTYGQGVLAISADRSPRKHGGRLAGQKIRIE